MAAGMFYWMIPRLYGTKLHSTKLANFHFYIGTFGILLYVVAMWTSGVTQGLMWRATNADGSLQYPIFVETIDAIRPMYWMRLIGGLSYLTGMIMMAYNLWVTARSGKPVNAKVDVVIEEDHDDAKWSAILFGKPVILTVVVGALGGLFLVTNAIAGLFFVTCAFAIGVLGALALSAANQAKGVTYAWHRLLEGRALVFVVLTILAVLVGGVAEIVPSLLAQPDPQTLASSHPYTALELEGRDIYIREGCYNCHSQMIRPFRFEQQRYGEPSTLSDSQFDHPFQWGSKRTGPDLAREGGKYPSLWHYNHMLDPRSVSVGSNMPPYKFLAEQRVDFTRTADKLHAMKSIGVPYNDQDVKLSPLDAKAQGEGIASDLKAAGADVAPDSELVALIAYLQRLGKQPNETRPTINVSMNGNGQ